MPSGPQLQKALPRHTVMHIKSESLVKSGRFKIVMKGCHSCNMAFKREHVRKQQEEKRILNISQTDSPRTVSNFVPCLHLSDSKTYSWETWYGVRRRRIKLRERELRKMTIEKLRRCINTLWKPKLRLVTGQPLRISLHAMFFAFS